MKVDVHIHTAEHSGCSNTPAAQMVRAARERGLDAVVIADHSHHLTGRERARLERLVPGVRVFRGAEITVTVNGRNEDVLVISSQSCQDVANDRANKMARLAAFAGESSALTILAHPFRYHAGISFGPNGFRPDALEIASRNTEARNHDAILNSARERHIPVIAASDAHSAEDVSLFYLELDSEVADEEALAAVVRAGAFRIDAHRPTLERRIERVAADEELARCILAERGSLEDFLRRGGRLPRSYHRVSAGKTDMPNTRVSGMRNGAGQA